MKTSIRFSKNLVLTEVQELRKKVRHWAALGMDDLQTEYIQHSPSSVGRKTAREVMLAELIISATYHMTNVLNLE